MSVIQSLTLKLILSWRRCKGTTIFASLQLFWAKVAEKCHIIDVNQVFVFAHSSQIELFDSFDEVVSYCPYPNNLNYQLYYR